MTDNDLDQLEKRQAAVHEAAHAVVSQALGYPCRASVFRNSSGSTDLSGEKLWGGRAEYVTDPNDHDHAVIAAAGLAGELLVVDDTTNGLAVVDYIETEVIHPSESDLCGFRKIGTPQVIGLMETVPIFDEAIELLRVNKAAWQWAIDQLVTGHSFTDGMLKERFERERLTQPNLQA